MKQEKPIWYEVEFATVRGPRFRPVHCECHHKVWGMAGSEYQHALIERIFYRADPSYPECAICHKPISEN